MSARVEAFSVTGEFLTTFARQRLLEDPGHAYRFLATALIGKGAEETVLAILKGEMRLVGDSAAGVKVVKQRESKALASWRKQVRYIYAGRFKHYGIWLRPVAVVEVFGPDDADFADQHASQADKKRWGRERARFYGGSGARVWTLRLPSGEEAQVIFEACSERPHWENPPLTPQEALDESLAAGRGLEARGHVVQCVDDEEEEDDDDDEQDEIRRARERQERDDREESRWQAYLDEARRIGEKVREQAGTDTFEMKLSDGRVLTIPRAPFIHWALERTEWRDTAPPWDFVAPVGFKCDLDSPAHTDWWCGAGIDIEEYRMSRSDAIGSAAFDEMFRLQQEAREAAQRPKFAGIFAALEKVRDNRHPATVIVDNGERTGVVGEDIAVFPDSEQRPDAEISKYKGIVVERGGPLAHIAVVSRGCQITLMLLKGAGDLLKPGMTVTLNPSAGRITILTEDSDR